MRRLHLAIGVLLLVTGCGGAGAGDSGADAIVDAAPDATVDAPFDAQPDASGPLAARLEGPEVAWLGEETCFRARHNGGPTATLRFFWGDGERDEVTGVEEACHRWAFPGEQLISVVVEARAMSADDSRGLRVLPRPSDPAPRASSTLVRDRSGRLWVVDEDSGTVATLRGETLALEESRVACDRPRTVAIGVSVNAVACQGDDTLRLLDAADLSERARVDLGVGSEPFGVVADPRGPGFFVSLLRDGRVVHVRESGELGVSVPVGREPRGLAMNADGVLLVARWRGDDAGGRVYAVDFSDLAAPALLTPAELPRQADLDSDTDNSGVPSFLEQVVFAPDGARALLPTLKSNNVTGTFRTGGELTSQTSARAIVEEVMLLGEAGAPEPTFRAVFDDLDFASSLTFSADGSRVFVAFLGAQRVLALDPFDFTIVGSVDQVGVAPRGLALSADGTRLFVHASLDRAVRAYDVEMLGAEPALAAETRFVAVEPLDAQVLLGKRIFYTSRDPRMSRTSYLACSSCHLDGEGDALVWDFTQRGEGLRNTISLLGRAGMAHGPVHWTANFDEIQDFEHDIRGGQGGAGFLPDDLFHSGTRDTTLGDPKAGLSPELDALAAYVTHLDDFGRSPVGCGSDTGCDAAVARGRATFEDPTVGCASCHSGDAFTDSGEALHDVGTAGAGSGGRLSGPYVGFDTPTLLGLWRTGPYLHDGSAATLREVLTTRNVGDTHGVTSGLSAAEVDDLLLFLRTRE